jgi:hypothetical protein
VPRPGRSTELTQALDGLVGAHRTTLSSCRIRSQRPSTGRCAVRLPSSRIWAVAPESAHSYPQFRPSEEASRNYLHHAPVGSRHQQKRLCTDAVHRPIEICEQQPGELQPRLIDDMATLGRRPLTAE